MNTFLPPPSTKSFGPFGPWWDETSGDDGSAHAQVCEVWER